MAAGDPVEQGLITQNSYHSSFKLIDAATGTGDGVWIDVRGFSHFSIDISGITTATVKISGSNDATKPANATHGRQIGADVTSDAIVSVETPIRWVKARVSAYTSGTITAILNTVVSS